MFHRFIIAIIAIGLLALLFVAGVVIIGIAVVALLGFVAWLKLKKWLHARKKKDTTAKKHRVIDAEFEIIDDK